MVLIAIIVTVLGLASRRYPIFPSVFQNYPGDALWATLVSTVWAFIFPRESLIRIATLTLFTSLVVELSQLSKANWLNTLRDNAFGRIVLGSGFDAIDLIAYCIGTLLGLGLIYLARTASSDRKPT